MPQCRLPVFAVLATLVWAAPAPVRASDLTPLSGYRVSSWSEDVGLPAGPIWALAQDGNGFLWIGSDAGLLRFDGVRFRTWHELAGGPLPQGAVRTLLVARDGNLWVGFGEQALVARIRGRNVDVYGSGDGLVGHQITALVEDASGDMWAGTDDGLLRLTDGKWARAGIDGRVTSVAASHSGDVYAATDTSIVKRTTGGFERLLATSAITQSLAVDSTSRLWATDRSSGYRRVGDEFPHWPGSPRGKGFHLLPDSKGNLWVATYGQGVWLVRSAASDHATVQAVTDAQGLSSNVVYALLEDRESNIWVGTTAGLNRLAPQRLTQVQDVGVVTGVEATADGTVWVNTPEGLTRFAFSNGDWRPERHERTRVRADAMHADAERSLWVASTRGLERFSSSGANTELITPDLRQVKSITSSPDGTVWIFDNERGLYRWKDGRVSLAEVPPATNGGRIVTIFADRTNRLWLSLQGETLMSVDANGSTRRYGPAEGFAAGRVRMFFEDGEGTLWIAGSVGLSRISNGRCVTLRRHARLPLDALTSVTEDGVGALWIGTGSGIVRITKPQFDAAVAGRWDDVSVVIIDAASGVAGTAGWTGQPSAIRTRDDRLWFLTGTGITIVDPRATQKETVRTPVRVDVVAIDDRRLPIAEGMTIPPTAARLQIEFSVPTLSPDEQTRFRYRLDGFDSTWINSGRLRTAIYTNLPPRAYRFRVQVQDASGSWHGEDASSWSFSVQPAFYWTPWFIGLCVAACVLAAWTAWRLRVSHVRRQLAIVHGERVRLSRELHDTLLQSLVGVALQCEALIKAPDHGSTRTGLLALRRQVEAYVRECRQSLWNLRSPLLDDHDLPTALRHVAERATRHSGVALDVVVTGTPRDCPGRIDEQILRIGQEAVTNAVRHSRASVIRLGLDYAVAAITLTVEDNGCGFDVADSTRAEDGHWGLVGMQERAHAARATLSIASDRARGTRVVVTVPVQTIDRNDGEETDHGAVHGGSPHRPRGDRADHQPAA
jgi:signal transduction histidine kinase/ligand-binding sensor domain-containing protein